MQIVALDGLGRANLSTTEDANSNIYSKVSAVYDLVGRAYQTYNPFTGASGSYYTSTVFDVLGRPTSVALPDRSSTTTYSYSLQTVTVTDPAGMHRESQSDGVGRLASIFEPNTSNNPNVQTSYAYNVLDELTAVTEGAQTRSFVYDGLGRMTSSSIPEMYIPVSGNYVQYSTSYTYDNWNNLLTRTDGRGVVTSYGYDGLNRPSTVTYNVGSSGVTAPAGVCGTSNTASMCLIYGTSASSYNKGLPITLTDTVGSESYTYNPLEQMTQLQKVINGTTYTIGYMSNVAGELTQITYPSGRTVSMPVDPIGRLSSVSDSSTTYASGYTYNAANLLTNLAYGNGLYGAFGFSSNLLQLTCLDYSTTNRSSSGCTHDSTSLFGLSYTYGYPLNSGNNGLIASITDSVHAGRTANYTYDWLYRLATATTTGDSNYAQWGLTMSYDRYGNRMAQSISSGCVAPMTCPTNSVSVDSYNHITGSPYAYDANGNMTNDGVNTLTYDVENHALSASGSYGTGTYTMDGKGLRVKKAVTNGNSTVYIFSGSKVIAEYDNGAAPGSPSREYIYSGAALLAKIDSTGTHYYHQDQLSNRMVTTSLGANYAEMGTFPFGESWYNASLDKLQFTTYETDFESGNDYAQARSYVNRLGRFSSLDPLSGSPSDPQSLNRYSYVRNMPTMAVDPSGAVDCPPASKNQDDGFVEGHGSFALARFDDWGPSADSEADTDPDPQIQGASQGCGIPPAGGLDGSDSNFTDYGGGSYEIGFAPGSSTTGISAVNQLITANTTPTSYLRQWVQNGWSYIDVEMYSSSGMEDEGMDEIPVPKFEPVLVPVYGNLGLFGLFGGQAGGLAPGGSGGRGAPGNGPAPAPPQPTTGQNQAADQNALINMQYGYDNCIKNANFTVLGARSAAASMSVIGAAEAGSALLGAAGSLLVGMPVATVAFTAMAAVGLYELYEANSISNKAEQTFSNLAADCDRQFPAAQHHR